MNCFGLLSQIAISGTVWSSNAEAEMIIFKSIIKTLYCFNPTVNLSVPQFNVSPNF